MTPNKKYALLSKQRLRNYTLIKYTANYQGHTVYFHLDIDLSDEDIESFPDFEMLVKHCTKCCQVYLPDLMVRFDQLNNITQERCELVHQ